MSEPIRILHILQRMEAGGTQALLMNMYRNLDRTKIQFDFLVHYKAEEFYDKEIRSMGGKIYKFSVREDFNFLSYCIQLKKFFRKHTEYRIIHGHMYTLGYIYLSVAKKCGVPVRIAHSHNNASEKNAKYMIKKIMGNLFNLKATDLFACSNQAGHYLFGNKEFTILNNAIDAELFALPQNVRISMRKQLGIENKVVIGHVGRFQSQKNHDFLIDVFREIKSRCQDAVLLLIGTGDLEKEIAGKISDCGLIDSVKFLGNRRDMPELYQAMDVFVFPSHFEGLGIVSIEAQAAGIPTVCSDGLPPETNITPLYYSVELNKSAALWADICIEAVKNPYSHQYMKNLIVDAGFDMMSTAITMQNYYINKYIYSIKEI